MNRQPDNARVTELVKRSAAWMAGAIRDRELSAVELLEAHTARIVERDPEINALVLPRLEAAREEALAADATLARGGEVPGQLHGVPFTAKDPIPVAGMRSPNGSKLLADYVCDEDAEVVRRMRAAGAILLGKTNVSEFAAWWDSVNPLFGATANPTTRRARPAVLARLPLWQWACRRWVSGPTSAARSATRATSSGCSASSRDATRCRSPSICRCQ
jgi:Asp-tRNA(Asn)/Glu-tRNA(Gln) amidotransferase A subunit family amidase